MRPRATTSASLAALAVLALAMPVAADQGATGATAPAETPTIGRYFDELERLGLVDIETGTKEALAAELGAAERLLQEGNPLEAAVALYAIVESPRFAGFEDFVEYQNAEYDLAVALAASGAYESSLDYLARVLARGPDSLYWAPAHRRAVDIALETRQYARILARIEGAKLQQPIPPEASGERAYLRARIAYDAGELAAAEAELVEVPRRSRLYSSALYMRGVLRARGGEWKDATDALCEVAEQPDQDELTFVVDDRYFGIKDLARLGLGRVAHEEGRYDDAYYHYFQVPEDSDRLSEALFEAAWSMYQKRELGTARDLVAEFLKDFPDSPLAPEAMLLAGYVELADCKFDEAQRHYDRVVAQLQPVVDELARLRKSSERRRHLFDAALARYRARRTDPDTRPAPAVTATDKVLAYLRLDPAFVRVHEAVWGMRRAAGDAPHVVRAWRSLAQRLRGQQVGAVTGAPTLEQEEASDATALLEDVRRLRDEVARARAELRRGRRANTLPADAAAAEEKRLAELTREVDALERAAERAAARADAALTADTDPQVGSMIRADLARARSLNDTARAFTDRLLETGNRLAVGATEQLYIDMRRVLDKAKLGKIDAVIGQKRKLDIEVTDLAAGRYPPELYGRLWEQGLIGDDEELWPFEGEMWKDEYEGWR